MSLPTRDYRRAHVGMPPDLHDGLDALVHDAVGMVRRRPTLRWSFGWRAARIAREAGKLGKRGERALAEEIEGHRQVFRRGVRVAPHLTERALAAVVVAAERALGLTAHRVQIMGALAMSEGYLVEMATGEGKSLTASLAAALAGWTGRPAHVITVNDYLTARDAEELAPFYRLCSVTVGCVTQEMDPGARRDGHEQDVVYTTSHQLLADFLRDRLAMGAVQHPTRRLIQRLLEGRREDVRGLVLRGLSFALVDEADSVLVDEAVTPLIISRVSENRALIEASDAAVKIASQLVEGSDYILDRRHREIRVTEAGRQRIEDASTALGGIWRGSPRRLELVVQALTARELYREGTHYVLADGKVVIVDEFTGRLMPDRTWSHGLHQAVEAKEGVDVTSPTETLARLSFQRFFRMFRRLCGMSGTVREAAAELWHIYELPLVSIPTHRRVRRIELADAVHRDGAAKLDAIVADVLARHATGRPVLVGTRSVRASEELAARLSPRIPGLAVLNAVRHREEAAIVARAGQRGAVTIATNMAGRGTDIKLGAGVAELGGLHVVATERNESQRIDRQLFGRCARQGDPGSAQAYVAPDDELIRRFVPAAARDALEGAARAGVPGWGLATRLAMRRAQAAAQALGYQQREGVLKMDEWLEEALAFAERSRAF